MEVKKRFAEGFCWKKILWIFILGSIFGCVYEVLLEFVKHGHWVSRQGLIYGPLNPVYGLGAILFTICLSKFKDWRIIFVLGTLVGGSFEYIASYFQELFFGTISWDYSRYFMNFNGRTSLFHALCWGAFALVFIKLVYPRLSNMIEKIPMKIGNLLTILVTIFLVFDCGISALAGYRQWQRTKSVPATNSLQVFLDKHYPDELMDRIYENKKTPKREKKHSN